jgi:hypothetical protein
MDRLDDLFPGSQHVQSVGLDRMTDDQVWGVIMAVNNPSYDLSADLVMHVRTKSIEARDEIVDLLHDSRLGHPAIRPSSMRRTSQ